MSDKGITKEQFTARWIANAGITQEHYDSAYLTMPCKCGYEGCEGWATITNDKESIGLHKRLNS